MNAVAVAAGLIEGGSEGARAKLETFWKAVSQAAGARFGGSLCGRRSARNWLEDNPAYRWLEILCSATMSPYDFNPLNHNPLRDILRKQVDFKAIRASSPWSCSSAPRPCAPARPRSFAPTN